MTEVGRMMTTAMTRVMRCRNWVMSVVGTMATTTGVLWRQVGRASHHDKQASSGRITRGTHRELPEADGHEGGVCHRLIVPQQPGKERSIS
jgi:hypothetical protein